MLEKFKKYIAEKKLFNPGDYILLAISGGIDSVVMAELFHLSKLRFAIAHCNFQLRGEESEEDERFVKKIALKYKVPFFSKKFDTAGYAGDKGISLQMAARELRYKWFEKIRKEFHFSYISVATQLDDEVETLLINITRGTGLSGLHGILPKKGKIVRPMLFATRPEILRVAAEKNLLWREDKSNLSDIYVRNKIRHKVVPVLKEINPGLAHTISENVERIRDAEEIFRQRIEEKQAEVFMPVNRNGIMIPVEKILELYPLKTYLFEFLRPFGFNETVVKEIASSLQRQSGKKFFSATHYLYKDRKHFIIKKIKSESKANEMNSVILVNKNTMRIPKPLSIKFRLADKKNFRIIKDEKTACLDYNKLRFPLILRTWKEGDSFIPLGMKGRKKISDFLTDKKVSLTEKKKIYVLVSFGKIAWVAGYRIDERFKVTEATKKIFISKLL